MAYCLLRPEARAMYRAIKPLRIGIRRSGRLDLALRSAAPPARSIASSPPRNGTPRHIRPRRSSCGQQLGRRDEHISWTTSFRLFSETSPRFRQLCVPKHSSISIPRAAARGVHKSFGAGTGQPLAQWRSLSRNRAADAQRPTNEAITAKTVMLVLEKADGSTETTVVSRKQALDAARIANLDLVQVNDKTEPVVCRLMNAKVEEYRRRRLLQVKSQRKQHKKEIRMKGMIASHDFERKANDIKRHLERGDMVKVVLDAPTSVLSRSLHCLDDLQAKIEEFIDPSTVVMKFSHGANALSRREITCTPKTKGSAKPNGKPKPKAESVVRPSSARLGKGLDEKVLSQLRTEAEGTDPSDSDSDGVPNDEDSETPVGLAEQDMGKHGKGESLSGGMVGEDDVGQGNSVEDAEDLDLEEALLWEMEDCVDFEAEDGESAGWGRQRSRRDTAAAQGQSKSNKAKDASGGGGRKTGGRKSGGVVDDVVYGVEDDEDFAGVGTSGGGARRERLRPGKRKGGARQGSEGDLERNFSPSAGGARSGYIRRENSVDSKQRVGRQGGVFGRGGGSVDGEKREGTSRAARIPPPVYSSTLPEGREGRGGINGPGNIPDQTIQPPQYRWGRINNREGVNAAEDGAGAINGSRENETAEARPRSRLPPKVSTVSSKEGASDRSASD